MQEPASGPPTSRWVSTRLRSIYWPGIIWPAVFAVAVFLGAQVGGRQGLAVVFGAAGVGLALVSVARLVRIRGLLRHGAPIEGTVVRVWRTKWTSDEGRTFVTYRRRVRFTTPDGGAVEFTSRVGTKVAPHEGQSVPVRYRADNPKQAEVDTPAAWKSAAILLLFGLALLITAAFIYRPR